jgi:hypothetical protein
MRTRASLLALVAAGVWAASALASSPAQIYNSYVQTGRLINQYGDPLTLARLKLAARRHLAGSCLKVRASTTTVGGTTSTSAKPQKNSKHRSQSKQPKPKQQGKKAQRLAAGKKASTGGDNSSFIAGRGLIIGLLAVALAFGGWLTKRALSTRD